MGRTTFWDVIERTIEMAGIPLSAKEIWDKANELGTIGDFKSNGKTPWYTIAAYCYTDINRNPESSMIIQVSNRPAKFYLRRLPKVDVPKLLRNEQLEVSKNEVVASKFHERDLHPILVGYAYADNHFKANLKTLFHESSSKGKKGQNEWLHPDLVGVYFPFSE